MEPRIASGAPKLIQVGDKYQSQSINLNHNMLTGPLDMLPSIVQKILIFPEALTSLDLSFNVFTEIPKGNIINAIYNISFKNRVDVIRTLHFLSPSLSSSSEVERRNKLD